MLGRKEKVDRRARRVGLQIGAGRIAIGVEAFFVTGPALRVLGFGEPDPGAKALAKLGGGRDIALGALTLAARDDPRALRRTMLISSACDLTDAIALGSSARHPETRKAGLGGLFSGGAAAIAGFWAARRLGDS